MKKKSKLYAANFVDQPQTFVFFDDIDLKIDVNVKWKNDQIEEMDFISDGKGIIKYKILDINPCKSGLFDFYMIHIYQHTDTRIPDPHKFTANTNQHLKGLKHIKKQDYVLFFFNIHSKPPIKIKKCTFNESQPETKDGSIIIGG